MDACFAGSPRNGFVSQPASAEVLNISEHLRVRRVRRGVGGGFDLGLFPGARAPGLRKRRRHGRDARATARAGLFHWVRFAFLGLRAGRSGANQGIAARAEMCHWLRFALWRFWLHGVAGR